MDQLTKKISEPRRRLLSIMMDHCDRHQRSLSAGILAGILWKDRKWLPGSTKGRYQRMGAMLWAMKRDGLVSLEVTDEYQNLWNITKTGREAIAKK